MAVGGKTENIRHAFAGVAGGSGNGEVAGFYNYLFVTFGYQQVSVAVSSPLTGGVFCCRKHGVSSTGSVVVERHSLSCALALGSPRTRVSHIAGRFLITRPRKSPTPHFLTRNGLVGVPQVVKLCHVRLIETCSIVVTS